MELVNAFKKGDWLTRSSAIVMGFGNILRKQFIKGILFLFTEAAFLFFMAAYGDRKSTRLNSSHTAESRMPSSA